MPGREPQSPVVPAAAAPSCLYMLSGGRRPAFCGRRSGGGVGTLPRSQSARRSPRPLAWIGFTARTGGGAGQRARQPGQSGQPDACSPATSLG